jgi:hypothetical protein
MAHGIDSPEYTDFFTCRGACDDRIRCISHSIGSQDSRAPNVVTKPIIRFLKVPCDRSNAILNSAKLSSTVIQNVRGKFA